MMHLMDKKEKKAHVEMLVAKERESRRDSWRKYYMNNEYIQFDCGVIEVGKPSIKSEFWYDDEGDSPLSEDPEQRKDYFIKENLRSHFNDFGLSEWRECEKALKEGRACSGRHLSRPLVAIWPSGQCYPVFMVDREWMEHDRRRGMVTVEMTDEEIEQFGSIIDGMKARYMKRLETYWKRYSDKVSAHGYWANR